MDFWRKPLVLVQKWEASNPNHQTTPPVLAEADLCSAPKKRRLGLPGRSEARDLHLPLGMGPEIRSESPEDPTKSSTSTGGVVSKPGYNPQKPGAIRLPSEGYNQAGDSL